MVRSDVRRCGRFALSSRDGRERLRCGAAIPATEGERGRLQMVAEAGADVVLLVGMGGDGVIGGDRGG